MNKQAAQELISSIDGKLYEANNKLSLCEYAQDSGDDVGDEITCLKQEINNLLWHRELAEAIECWSGEDANRENPLLARKAHLLARKQRFSAIEHDRQLLTIGQEVRERITGLQHEYSQVYLELYSPDRPKRQCAQTKMSKLGAELEPVCRRWSQLANEVSCKHGYNSYVDACLANEDLSLCQLTDLFQGWKQARMDQFRALVSQQGPEDLLYLISTYKARLDDVFGRKSFDDAFSDLLPLLGLDLDRLPISFEKSAVGFPGACYRIEPGTDIRIVVNSHLSGFSSYFFSLHEFGHAMYYHYCPKDSELLIDDQVARETMADMWTLFLRDPLFLRKIVGASEEDIVTVHKAMSDYFTLRLFLFMRDTMFTVHILTEPSSSFAELWCRANNDWLGIDDSSGAFDLYDSLHPLAMKNYVFAQVLSEKAMQQVDGVLSPQMITSFREYCRQGNAIGWKTKFEIS